MSSKTSHARIEKDVLKKIKNTLPGFTPNEVTKVGLKVLVGIDKSGEFIYGKKTWNKFKKK